MNKQDEYAQKIISHLNEIFKEDCENYIDPEELTEGDNGTLFFHALGNLAGCYVYNVLVGETDMLGYNHVLNRLCLQYAEKD